MSSWKTAKAILFKTVTSASTYCFLMLPEKRHIHGVHIIPLYWPKVQMDKMEPVK